MDASDEAAGGRNSQPHQQYEHHQLTNTSSDADVNLVFPSPANGRIRYVGSYRNGNGYGNTSDQGQGYGAAVLNADPDPEPIAQHQYYGAISSDLEHESVSHSDSGVSTFTGDSATNANGHHSNGYYGTNGQQPLPPVPKRPVVRLSSSTPC